MCLGGGSNKVEEGKMNCAFIWFLCGGPGYLGVWEVYTNTAWALCVTKAETTPEEAYAF